MLEQIPSLGVIGNDKVHKQSNDDFLKRLALFFNTKYKDPNYGKYYRIPAHYLNGLTIDQMVKLGSKNSKVKSDQTYKQLLFSKRYHGYFSDPEYYQNATPDKIRKLLIKIRSENSHDTDLKAALLRDILIYGIKLDTYDKALFLEYLQSPLYCGVLDPKHKNLKYDNWSHTWEDLKLKPAIYDDQIFEKYLEYFFNIGDTWREYEKYLDKTWVKYFKIRCDFYSGKELPKKDLEKISSVDMTKEVLINLHVSNKQNFKVNERVRIVTEIKNVPKLYVKVFEFNTLNYFKKTNQPFKTDVNLDGLIATKEFEYDFEEPSAKKFRKVFDFPHLDDQVGVFIIEFIGNGYSSRATIKKGALTLVERMTIAGKMVYIVDEDKHICCSEDTGIWFENQFYPADVENGGRILIPYMKYSSSGSAILVHEGFAHLTESFEVPSEQYDFTTAFILHPESLVMGNEATLLVRPFLSLNDKRVDSSLMENCTVVVTTTSFVDDIPVTKNYEDLKVDSNNEIVIEFQVPPNLARVDTEFTCSVKNITTGSKEEKRADKMFALNTNVSNAKYYE